MLDAVLHRKLHESIPEPQRLEDALTSTVFGLLIRMNAWQLLADWIGLPRARLSIDSDHSQAAFWFWPRLELAEPDLILRIGDYLVVVEAKYRSGRHDTAAIDGQQPDTSDQIVRQYRSIVLPRGSRLAYPKLLEKAIDECQLMQVVVVDAMRMRSARREFEESRIRLPKSAVLALVTWQRLFHLLGSYSSDCGWAIDLRSYLAIASLDSFDRISRQFPALQVMKDVFKWKTRRRAHGFQSCVIHPDKLAHVDKLLSWNIDQLPGRRLDQGWYQKCVQGFDIFCWKVLRPAGGFRSGAIHPHKSEVAARLRSWTMAGSLSGRLPRRGFGYVWYEAAQSGQGVLSWGRFPSARERS